MGSFWICKGTAADDTDGGQEVIDQLDVRIFLRVPEPVLRKRRHERHGYHTAGKQSSLDGEATLTGVLNDLPPNEYPTRFRFASTLVTAPLEFNLIQRAHSGETHRAIGNK